MKWISTKERLPEESSHYLCWCVDGFGNKWPVVRYWDSLRKGFYPKNENNLSQREAYWMPLPAPPSEEEILAERITDLEKNPEEAISWEEVREEKEFKVGMKVRVVKNLFGDEWEYGTLGRIYNNPIGSTLFVDSVWNDDSYKNTCQKYNVPFKRFVKAGGWDFHPDELEIIE